MAALGTAGFFLLLTVKLVIPAIACGVLAFVMVLRWLWDTDSGPAHPPVDIGGGTQLPVYLFGRASHSWWAMAVLMLVSGSIFGALLFSYLFLWTVSPHIWASGDTLPALAWPLAAAALLLASGGLIAYAGRRLQNGAGERQGLLRAAIAIAILLLDAALGVDLYGQWQSGLKPQQSAYGAVVYAILSLQGFFALIMSVMGSYTIARSRHGLLNARRRVTFDNTMLFWHYTVAQGLIGITLVHAFPRFAG